MNIVPSKCSTRGGCHWNGYWWPALICALLCRWSASTRAGGTIRARIGWGRSQHRTRMSCCQRISRSSLRSLACHISQTAAPCKQRVGRLLQHLHRFVRGRTTQLDFGNDSMDGLAMSCCYKEMRRSSTIGAHDRGGRPECGIDRAIRFRRDR